MALSYSFIIPVYNRPGEISELLASMAQMEKGRLEYEVIVVEDGSAHSSKTQVDHFNDRLDIRYFFIENSGPGNARNYGMKNASGNYFIILDSDVILPSAYLKNVDDFLSRRFVDCFGGADAADKDFTPVQKGITYAMTSFLTTGGIRGNKSSLEKFKPRSFNMGLSKRAFIETGGFANIGVGEDLDLSIRVGRAGFKTVFIPGAQVYHKRRTTWKEFYNQVKKFGMGRPILNQWHPQTFGLVFWFPSLFLIGMIVGLLAGLFWGTYAVLSLYVLYFLFIFVTSSYLYKDFKIGIYSVYATLIQFVGYGLGYLKSIFYIKICGKKPREAFPELFFD